MSSPHGKATSPEHRLGICTLLAYAMRVNNLLEKLGQLVTEVAEKEIAPRYKRLTESDFFFKPTLTDPDDLATSADRAAEAVLSQHLCALLPGSVVVGEEAVSEKPEIMRALHSEAPVWLIDPVDGTKNFACGSGPFGSMVALVRHDEILLSAIYMVREKELYLAERGGGATGNGVRLQSSAADGSELRGTLYQKFLTSAERDKLNLEPPLCEFLPVHMCAAFEYPRVARGESDFAVFCRLYPWDHAPGALLLREAGGIARQFEGKEYSPLDEFALLLIAPNEARWQIVRERMARQEYP